MSESKGSRVFPEAPRWPESNYGEHFNAEGEEKKTKIITEEPLLAGPPHSEEESLFLSTPELSAAADIITAYRQAEGKIEKKRVVVQAAQDFLKDPRRLTSFFDAVELLQGTGVYSAKKFAKEIEDAITEVKLPAAPLSAVEFGRWITLYAESKVYQNIAERVLRRVLEQCPDEKTVVDACYNLALGGLRSSNQAVVRKTVQILGHLAPVMGPGTKAGLLYSIAKFSPDMQLHTRAREIDAAIAVLREKFEGFKEKIDAAILKIQTHSAFKKLGLAIRKNHPEWAGHTDKLLRVMQSNKAGKVDQTTVLKWIRAAESGDVSGIPEEILAAAGINQKLLTAAQTLAAGGAIKDIDPESLAKLEESAGLAITASNVGPLGQWINDVRVEEINGRGKQMVSVHLPEFHQILPADIKTIHSIIKTFLHQETDENEPAITSEQYWRTLAHYVPKELVDRQNDEHVFSELGKYNVQLIEEMRTDSIHLLSPRGDWIEFEDQLLTELGFKRIFFRMDERNRRDTVVRLEVGNYTYEAVVDEYFALQELENTGTSIILPSDGEFLRSIILSHLHAIRCTDLVTDADEDGPEEGARVFRGRRAHRRILPEGHKPTREQINVILQKYQVDIERMNRERDAEAAADGKKNSRKLTYVSHSDPNESGPPVRSVAPRAIDHLKRILAS